MFGADIEFFIKEKGKDTVIPSCGRIGGTKEKAIKIDDTYSILEDGAAVELNYKPTNDVIHFVENILASTAIIENFTGFSIFSKPESKITGLKQHKQAMEIGCVEDFDAYAPNPEAPRDVPNIKEFGSYRFAGGHLHLSYEADIPKWAVARLMDVLVTIPVISNSRAYWNSDVAKEIIGTRRSKYYGLAGLYRPKDYGIEYRVLSNNFAFNRYKANWVANGLNRLSKVLNNNIEGLNNFYMNIDWPAIKSAITDLAIDKITDLHVKIEEQAKKCSL